MSFMEEQQPTIQAPEARWVPSILHCFVNDNFEEYMKAYVELEYNQLDEPLFQNSQRAVCRFYHAWSDLKDDIEKSMAEIHRVEASNKELFKGQEGLKKDMKSLASKLSKVEEDEKQAKDLNIELQKTHEIAVESLKVELRNTRQTYDRIHLELEGSRGNVESLQKTVQEAIEDAVKMSSKYEELQSDFEKAQKEADETVNALKAELEMKITKYKNLGKGYDKKKAQIEELKTANAELRDKKAQLITQLEDLGKEVDERFQKLQSEFEAEKKNLENEVISVKSQAEERRRNLRAEKDMEIDGLKRQLMEERKQASEAYHKLQAASDAMINELNVRLNESERVEAENFSLSFSYDQAKKALETKDAEILELNVALFENRRQQIQAAFLEIFPHPRKRRHPDDASY